MTKGCNLSSGERRSSKLVLMASVSDGGQASRLGLMKLNMIG